MSLSAALARKQRREEHCDVLVDDPTEHEAAVKAAERAVLDAAADHGVDSEQVTQASAALEHANQQLASCYQRVRFRNLKPDAFEALVAAHAPTKAQQDTGALWNKTTLAPALLAACAIDSDLTEDGWTELFASGLFSLADRDALFGTALAANVTGRSASIPKG